MFYVYAYFEPGGCVPFYIGKGHGNRSHMHFRLARRRAKTPFHKKLVSLGFQADVVILTGDLTEAQAFAQEAELIAFHGRRDLGAGPLLNLTDGGQGQSGRAWTPEQRKKLSESKKGTITSETSKRLIGIASAASWTDERRQEQSQRLSGNRLNESYANSIKRPVLKKYKGVLVARFDSISQIIKQGFNPCGIYRALSGKAKRAYGFEWEYE